MFKLKEIDKHKIDILIIVSLFLIGFGVRMIPSESFPGIYGFDSFYHARIVRTLLQTGEIPEKDPLSYWPEHGKYRESYPPFYHYTLAGWYSWVKLLTTGSTGYEENLFVPINNTNSAFYGGLAVVAMYLLGLAVRNRKAGLFSAMLFIGQTTHIFRTMFGFTEEDPAGIFFYALSLAVFAFALRKGKPKYGWIAGVVFGAFLITWRMSIFPAAMIAAFSVIEIIVDAVNKEFDSIERRVEVLLASLPPIIILDRLFETTFTYGLMTIAFLGAAAFVGVLATYLLKYRKETTNKAKMYKIGLAIFIIIGIALFAWKGNVIMNKTYSLVFKAPVESSKLAKTVGEEHGVGITGVLRDVGILVPFYLIGLIWLPIRRWLHRKEHTVDILVWLLTVVTLYLYANKAKMGYIFGVPEMLIVGIVLADAFSLADWIKERSKANTKWLKAGVAIIAIILFGSLLAKGVIVASSYKGGYSPQTGWIKAYDYLTSLPDKDDIVMMTWWDYGHWSAWWGLKTTLDNTNQNASKVMETARIFTDFRGNSTDDILKKHLDELKKWQVTHIGVDRIVITCQKWGALTFLGDNQLIPLEEARKWGLPTKGLVVAANVNGTQQPMVYAGCMTGVYCKPGMDKSGNQVVICPLGKSQLVLTPSQWNGLVNAKWPGYDLTLNIGNGQTTVKAYARPDGYLMFFTNGQGIVPDAPANYMLGYRLFFQDPSIKGLDLVGDFYGKLDDPKYKYVPEEEVVIWKVDYDKLEMNSTEA